MPNSGPCVFFFNDTATTEIYTLSLHDALPISKDHLAADSRRVAEERKALERSKGDIGKRSKEIEVQAGLVASREDEAAELKSKAMSLLKYAEKVAEEKSREL